jgi:C6 transcription factor Pro1
MDGGVKQRQKSEDVKAQVKRQARHCRAQEQLELLKHQLHDEETPVALPSPPSVSITWNALGRSRQLVSGSSNALDDRVVTTCAAPAQVQAPSQHTRPEDAAASGAQEVLEDVLLMCYIDYVFPMLYPVYRLPIAAGCRGWLLHILRRNSCIRYAVIALSTHFLGRLRNHAATFTQVCEVLDASYMHTQTQAALQSAQQDLTSLQVGRQPSMIDNGRMFCSILQLLVSEIQLGHNGAAHLAGAVTLFRQIVVESKGRSGSDDVLKHVMDELGAAYVLQRPTPPLYTPDQTSFRSYAAQLMFSDVTAAIASETEPQLHDLSAQVLIGKDDEYAASKLDISEVLGLPNEIFLSLSSIASLAAWKKRMIHSSQLSLPELVRRSEDIEADLMRHIEALLTRTKASHSQLALPIDFMIDRSPLSASTSNTIHQIWAYSAQAYLFITTCGLQLSHPQLRSIVSKLVSLFGALVATDSPPAAPRLRALAWPVCAVGLLVQSADEERSVRELLKILQPLDSFATVRQLVEVVEMTWAIRKQEAGVMNPALNFTVSLGAFIDGRRGAGLTVSLPDYSSDWSCEVGNQPGPGREQRCVHAGGSYCAYVRCSPYTMWHTWRNLLAS